MLNVYELLENLEGTVQNTTLNWETMSISEKSSTMGLITTKSNSLNKECEEIVKKVNSLVTKIEKLYESTNWTESSTSTSSSSSSNWTESSSTSSTSSSKTSWTK